MNFGPSVGLSTEAKTTRFPVNEKETQMPFNRTSISTNHVTRRHVLSVGAAAGAGALASGLAGCSGGDSGGQQDKIKNKIEHPSDNLKRKGFPIVEKPITLHFMTRKFATNADDFNKVASWKKYQKMTNIEIDWGLVPLEDIEEKRNLALNGDDYPEAFHGCAFTTRDVGKYGRQGIFATSNSLIEKYMPNLKKLMDNIPEVKAGLTFPDGSIYSLPTIWDPDYTAMRNYTRLWVRGDWLKKLDLDTPRTTDDYHKFLKAAKKRFDSSGYCDAAELDLLRQGLRGSFGVGNRGQDYIDVDPSDASKVRFYRTDEAYKALLEYLHRLYSDGLIAKNALSIEDTKFYSNLPKGIYSSTVNQLPSVYEATEFVPIGALKGPDGDQEWNAANQSLNSIGQFVMTDKCKRPAEMARWMDYFYSTKGAKLFFLGVEGESYTETKDGPKYVKKIRNPPKGVNSDEAVKPYTTQPGGNYPGFLTEGAYISETGTSAEAVKAAKLLAPDSPKEVWPSFTYTEDESQKLDSLAEDIEKYVDESYGRFISGDVPLSKWDKYIEKIKQMGLDDYMEIQQAAYDRYRKNK